MRPQRDPGVWRGDPGQATPASPARPWRVAWGRRKGTPIPSETLACGAGTQRRGDACVPSETLACGAGTQRKGDACVPEASACGAGTSLVNGKCTLAQPETKTCWTNGNCSGFLGLDPCTNSSGVGPGQNLCTYCPGAGQKCQLSMR